MDFQAKPNGFEECSFKVQEEDFLTELKRKFETRIPQQQQQQLTTTSSIVKSPEFEKNSNYYKMSESDELLHEIKNHPVYAKYQGKRDGEEIARNNPSPEKFARIHKNKPNEYKSVQLQTDDPETEECGVQTDSIQINNNDQSTQTDQEAVNDINAKLEHELRRENRNRGIKDYLNNDGEEIWKDPESKGDDDSDEARDTDKVIDGDEKNEIESSKSENNDLNDDVEESWTDPESHLVTEEEDDCDGGKNDRREIEANLDKLRKASINRCHEGKRGLLSKLMVFSFNFNAIFWIIPKPSNLTQRPTLLTFLYLITGFALCASIGSLIYLTRHDQSAE